MRSVIADILFWIAGILWGIELFPQIIKTIRIKSSKDFSLAFLWCCWTAYIIYITGAFLIKRWSIFVPHLTSLVGMSVLIILVYKYRRENK